MKIYIYTMRWGIILQLLEPGDIYTYTYILMVNIAMFSFPVSIYNKEHKFSYDKKTDPFVWEPVKKRILFF